LSEAKEGIECTWLSRGQRRWEEGRGGESAHSLVEGKEREGSAHGLVEGKGEDL